ncbi:MAG: hypothetical protein WC683_04470 [bacterium]
MKTATVRFFSESGRELTRRQVQANLAAWGREVLAEEARRAEEERESVGRDSVEREIEPPRSPIGTVTDSGDQGSLVGAGEGIDARGEGR